MLEPWIIEQIRRREEEERRKNEGSQLELPVHEEPWPPQESDRSEDDRPSRWDRREEDREPKRGVVIIGL